MFVCGPTVQGRMHMGHARTYVFYDVLARYLSRLGYRVRFVMNITDLDESITSSASAARTSPRAYADRYAGLFLGDMKRLKIEAITDVKKVSDYIPVMLEQVSSLIEAGHAYSVDGWVYFDTSTFPRFGRLSHMSKKELALRPLELSLKKRNLTDFALWRPEILERGKWSSPWGRGSPGWHIQDTAVSISILGENYDLHGGAYELIYPHHEAEIAQAESLTGKSPFVKYWVHTHLVNMEGAKMSKTAGNVYNVEDALKVASADAIRLFLLRRHYRSDMDLSGLEGAEDELGRLRESAKTRTPRNQKGSRALKAFYAAMNDDMDTPSALQAVVEAVLEGGSTPELLSAVSEILGVDLAKA